MKLIGSKAIDNVIESNRSYRTPKLASKSERKST